MACSCSIFYNSNLHIVGNMQILAELNKTGSFHIWHEFLDLGYVRCSGGGVCMWAKMELLINDAGTSVHLEKDETKTVHHTI